MLRPPDRPALVSPQLLAVLGLIASILIYAGQFVSVRHAVLNGLTSYDMTALRFGVAGLVLLPLFLRRGWRDCAGIGWGRGLLLTVTGGAPLVTIMNGGLAYAPAAHGAAIQPGMVVLVTTVAGAWIAGQRLGLVRGAALALVLGGLVAIGFSGARTFGRETLLGDAMFVVSGSGFAVFTILCERWRLPPLTAAAVVSVLSLTFLPIYALLLGPQLDRVSLPIVLAHGFNQGILLVVFGLTVWAYAVRLLGLQVVGWFSPLIPVCGVLLAIPGLGEWPTATQGAGVLLVVGGLFGLAAAHARRVRAAR